MSLLILREEFVCLVVIAFILCYTAVYKIKTEHNTFFRILIYALGHVIFDIITVITVNNLDTVPPALNAIFHIMYYALSIAFTMAFYEYIVLLTTSKKVQKIARIIKYIPALIYAVVIFIFPVEYVAGNGTNYSYGPLVIIGYGIFVIYCIICFVLVVANHNKLEPKKKFTLYPMTGMMILVIVVQAMIPELLMTSAGITFVCLGLFATFNNPAKEYREQVYWDAATGIKNKNGYKMQLEQMEKKYGKKKTKVGFVICDMNGLKVINDKFGHMEGDKLLRAAAGILNANMKHAHDVYRVGGDEFVAIYISPKDEVVKADIAEVRKACEAYKDSPIILSIAIGYAAGEYSSDYMEIYNRADDEMYQNKAEIKKQHPELCGR